MLTFPRTFSFVFPYFVLWSIRLVRENAAARAQAAAAESHCKQAQSDSGTSPLYRTGVSCVSCLYLSVRVCVVYFPRVLSICVLAI